MDAESTNDKKYDKLATKYTQTNLSGILYFFGCLNWRKDRLSERFAWSMPFHGSKSNILVFDHLHNFIKIIVILLGIILVDFLLTLIVLNRNSPTLLTWFCFDILN